MVWKGAQLVGVKLIFLLRTLVLARLLLPEDFGMFAIAMLSVHFLSNITNVGMIPALVQRENVTDNQYHTAFTVGILRAALIAVVVFLGAPIIANLYKNPNAVPLIRAATLMPIFEAGISIKLAELTRNLNFKALALIYLAQAVANVTVSVFLAGYVGAWALIAGIYAGVLALLLTSYYFAPYRPRLQLNFSEALPLIRFGRWVFLTSLVAVCGSSLLSMIISRQLGVVELGLYFLAAKLAFIPNEISAEVIGAVAFPMVARLQNKPQQVAKAFRSLIAGISAIIIPFCGLLIILTPSLVTHVLGEKWEGTTTLIQLLAIVNLIGFIGDAIVPILNGMGKPYQVTIVEFAQSIALVGLIWTLTERFGVNGAALAWIGAVSLSQILNAWFVMKIIPKPFQSIGKLLSAISLITIFGVALAYQLDVALPGLLGFVVAGIGGVLLISALIWQADNKFQFGILDNVRILLPQRRQLAGMPPK